MRLRYSQTALRDGLHKRALGLRAELNNLLAPNEEIRSIRNSLQTLEGKLIATQQIMDRTILSKSTNWNDRQPNGESPSDYLDSRLKIGNENAALKGFRVLERRKELLGRLLRGFDGAIKQRDQATGDLAKKITEFEVAVGERVDGSSSNRHAIKNTIIIAVAMGLSSRVHSLWACAAGFFVGAISTGIYYAKKIGKREEKIAALSTNKYEEELKTASVPLKDQHQTLFEEISFALVQCGQGVDELIGSIHSQVGPEYQTLIQKTLGFLSMRHDVKIELRTEE